VSDQIEEHYDEQEAHAGKGDEDFPAGRESAGEAVH
jgi:hypothetical protein